VTSPARPATPAAVLALPDSALVPVGWIRPLLEAGSGCDLGLTVAQVAEMTGRAGSTIRTWCAEGRLPGARRLRGREWRVPQVALTALLDGESERHQPQTLPTPSGGLAAWRGAQR
jgi:excisionase family DNA binding protein